METSPAAPNGNGTEDKRNNCTAITDAAKKPMSEKTKARYKKLIFLNVGSLCTLQIICDLDCERDECTVV